MTGRINETDLDARFEELSSRVYSTLEWTRRQGIDVFFDPAKLNEKLHEIASRSAARERR